MKPSMHWRLRAKQTWSLAGALWAKLGEAVADYRNRQTTATLYAELSRLSDAELERRGIARGDLYRHIADHLGGDPPNGGRS